MNIKKLILYICTIMILVSTVDVAYAELPPYKLPTSTEEEKEEETLELTVDLAVSYGLENNTNIKMLDNKISLALLARRNAFDNIDDLKDANEQLSKASKTLSSKQSELTAAQKELNAATTALNAGITPVAVPLVDGVGSPIKDAEGKQIVLPAGTNIVNGLMAIGIPESSAIGMAGVIDANIRTGLNESQSTINQNSVALNEAKTTLSLKNNEFDNVLKDTSDKLGAKIDFNTIVSFNSDDASKLMITMAGVNLDVTRYAKNIYRNQIAMLIQKNYYDALYAEKVFKLKKVAEERGKKQYNIVKLSYDNGMKAKDDLLLSKMYYDSTIISSRLAEATYKNTLFELKMNMNLNMGREIVLKDSMIKVVTIESLEYGLKTGLTSRIEIQQTLGQLMIYELNEDILEAMYKYRKDDEAYEEAVLLKDGAKLQLEKTKIMINSEINQSYELMTATGEMLTASSELIKNAEEVVKIATLKYEQGLGAENALLKSMNLEESSGTVIELIVAQENLAEIESQVANIIYSYTMAKVKYLNDSGILVY